MVVGIGAATNIANALLLEPDLCRSIVVIWLGGHALFWPSAPEFNLLGDAVAARVLFDSGVPLVHIPGGGAARYLSVPLPP